MIGYSWLTQNSVEKSLKTLKHILEFGLNYISKKRDKDLYRLALHWSHFVHFVFNFDLFGRTNGFYEFSGHFWKQTWCFNERWYVKRSLKKKKTPGESVAEEVKAERKRPHCWSVHEPCRYAETFEWLLLFSSPRFVPVCSVTSWCRLVYVAYCNLMYGEELFFDLKAVCLDFLLLGSLFEKLEVSLCSCEAAASSSVWQVSVEERKDTEGCSCSRSPLKTWRVLVTRVSAVPSFSQRLFSGWNMRERQSFCSLSV